MMDGRLGEEVRAAIDAAGFDCVGEADAASLVVKEAVRDMCAADRCRQYGRNWACPPACGSLAVFEGAIGGFDRCAVMQTVAQLEDDFDAETMLEAESTHKERTDALLQALANAGVDRSDYLLLSVGTCTRCRPCAYPEPCRFPDRRLVSMEAAGLVVTEVCEAAEIPYNHGPQTIAYTGCILFD